VLTEVYSSASEQKIKSGT